MVDVDADTLARELIQKGPRSTAVVDGLGVPVAAVDAALAELRRRTGGPKGRPGWLEAPLRPFRGSVYGVLALAFLAGSIWGFYAFGFSDDHFHLSVLGLAAALYLGVRGVVCFRADAETLVARDGRAPVIFLRSFRDDDAMIKKSSRFSLDLRRFLWTEYTRSGLFSLMWHRGKVRLEQAIEDEVQAIGPFIAIGEPNEGRPDFGATRAYFEGDDQAWRSAVQSWMDRAAMIVVMPGPTKGLGWEIEQIFARGHAGKLVLVLPPEGLEQRSARIAALTQMLTDPRWRQATELPDQHRLLALLEGADGEIVRCLSADAREAELDASVLLAQFFILAGGRGGSAP